jgi:hypothetical protein
VEKAQWCEVKSSRRAKRCRYVMYRHVGGKTQPADAPDLNWAADAIEGTPPPVQPFKPESFVEEVDTTTTSVGIEDQKELLLRTASLHRQIFRPEQEQERATPPSEFDGLIRTAYRLGIYRSFTWHCCSGFGTGTAVRYHGRAARTTRSWSYKQQHKVGK